jgi:hypothetical protein
VAAQDGVLLWALGGAMRLRLATFPVTAVACALSYQAAILPISQTM